MFTGWDRPSHWLVLAVVVVVLFGYKKLPDAARSVGRSLRIFKTEIKGMGEDDKVRAANAQQAEAAKAVTVPTTAAATPAAAPPPAAAAGGAPAADVAGEAVADQPDERTE
jgi:sec-independent protein translocase protein TatA